MVDRDEGGPGFILCVPFWVLPVLRSVLKGLCYQQVTLLLSCVVLLCWRRRPQLAEPFPSARLPGPLLVLPVQGKAAVSA